MGKIFPWVLIGFEILVVLSYITFGLGCANLILGIGTIIMVTILAFD